MINRLNLSFITAIMMSFSTFGQPNPCGPQTWWDTLWYGINGGACSYGEPTATFFPSFPQCDNKPFVLIFKDDFNGTQLDRRLWYENVSPQGPLNTSSTQEYNSLNNVTLNNGICTITAKRQDTIARAIPYYNDNAILEDGIPNLRVFNFTSANLWTNFRFGYGRYVIKYRVDLQQGMWPAFWDYNKDNGIWNEVDWFELTGNNPNRWHGTLHHDRYGDGCDHFCVRGIDNVADFGQWCIFSGDYSFDHISWSQDGASLDYRTRYFTSDGHIVECGDDVSNNLLFEPAYWPVGKFPIIFNMSVYRHAPEAPAESFYAADYDVDYIEHYVQDGCCGDLIISSSEMLGMSSDLTDYNYLCAKSIDVSGEVHIDNGENMTFISIQELTFNPGFIADSGAYVTTILQPDVIPCCDINVTTPIPNVFTPNGDGVNDNYCIHVDGATSFNVWVIDSWGNTIYSGSGAIIPDQDPDCIWDGTGAQSGDAYAIAIELFNPCSGDEPVRVGTTTHVYRDAPGSIMDNNSPDVNYSNLLYPLDDSIGIITDMISESEPGVNNYYHSNVLNDWDFSIQPNPSGLEAEVLVDGKNIPYKLEFRLIDMRGIDLNTRYIFNDNKIILNVQNISSGIYWLEVSGGDKTIYHKLVVIH